MNDQQLNDMRQQMNKDGGQSFGQWWPFIFVLSVSLPTLTTKMAFLILRYDILDMQKDKSSNLLSFCVPEIDLPASRYLRLAFLLSRKS